MKSKKKIRKKKSLRMRGYPDPEGEQDQFIDLDEELNGEFFDTMEQDDFDIDFEPEENPDW
ncbi:MAG: hypothetical protein ACUVUD_03435 [bacterium]